MCPAGWKAMFVCLLDVSGGPFDQRIKHGRISDLTLTCSKIKYHHFTYNISGHGQDSGI
jgi:hypothetical protein